METKNYHAIIEAILFTMGESVELGRIAEAIELDKKETQKILEEMMEHYKDPSIGYHEKTKISAGNGSLRISFCTLWDGAVVCVRMIPTAGLRAC